MERDHASHGRCLAIGDWILDPGSQRLRRGAESHALNPKEMSVLLHLTGAAPDLVSTRDLLDRTWPNVVVGDHVLHEVVGRLRRALGDRARQPKYIETLTRRGYRMVAPVAAVPIGPERADDHAESIRHVDDELPATRPPQASVRPRQWLLWSLPSFSVIIVLLLAFLGWATSRPPGGIPAGTIRSIAVLPLENLSGDPQQEYFADGVTEMLIGDLGKVGSLSVIARPSVMRFKGTSLGIREIAEALDVEAILSGSVMREADRIRISLQLVDGRTEYTLWSERYDRDLSGVLDLQSDIARAVADQVRMVLSSDETVALGRTHAVDPAAYDDYLRGMRIMRNSPALRASSWAPRAIPLFERAVKTDPDFAQGWASLGMSRAVSALSGSGDLNKARQAAERAVALDDRSSDAHAALGWVQLFELDLEAAGETWKRAVELNPNSVSAVLGYARYLQDVAGRSEEAIALAARLRLLDPLSPSRQRDYADFLRIGRFYEQGIDEIHKLRSEFPDFGSSVIERDLYRTLTRYQPLRRSRLEMIEQCGAPCTWSAAFLERLAPADRHEDYMQALLDVEVGRLDEAPSSAALYLPGSRAIAILSIWLGDFDAALEWLEKAFRDRDPMMWQIKAHDFFDPIRTDPRYQELLRRVGYPEWEPDPGTLAETGRALALMGRVEEAIEHVGQALELSPEDSRSGRWLLAMAFAYFAAQRYELAAGWCLRALEDSAHRYTTEDAYLLLAASYAHLERTSESRAALDAARATWPDFSLRFAPLPPYTAWDVRNRYLTGLTRSLAM